MDLFVAELTRCLQRARMRPVRKMAAWLESELIVPDGPHESELFSWQVQPITRLLIDEIDSGRWTEIFVAGPSQSGKTLIGFCTPCLYHTLELGETYVLGIPDMRMANNKWQMDLLPVIRANRRLEQLLPTSGPGSQGGIVRDTITFLNGGVIKFMSAGGSDQQRAGFTSRIVGITEAARFSRVSETSKEADPLRQLRARQASYDEPDRLLYVEGTVTVEEDLPWSAKAESSESKIVSQCPHCGEWIAPERENLVGWQECENAFDAGLKAVWACSECGEAIIDTERREAVANSKLLHKGQSINKRGEISGELPPTNRLWFRYSGWHNLFVSTSTLAKEEWRASQIDSESIEYENALKELSQFKWCVPYRSRNVESQPLEGKDVLRKKSKLLPKGVLPPETVQLALGVDAGKYNLHYVLLAGLSDGRLHVPDYGIVEVPSAFLDWEEAIKTALYELFDLAEAGWLVRSTGAILSPGQTWIDTGYEPDGIFKAILARYGRTNRKSKVLPILGRGSGQMERMYLAPAKRGNGIFEIGHHWHIAKEKRFRSVRVFTDSDHWKDRVQDSFKLEDGKPGSITIYAAPDREHDRFKKHITNEHRKVEFVPGRGEVVKFDRKGQNHWGDALSYARAALDRLGWKPDANLDTNS